MLVHASPLDSGGRFGGQNLEHVLPLVCSRFLNRNKQTLLSPKPKWHPTRAKRVGLPGRGRLACRATEAGFQITDSPASRQEKQDGGCPRRSAAAAPENLSFADAVERRQADIVRLDGEDEGDEEKESELEREEVGDKREGAAKVGRASRPERPKSVYTGRPRARRLGARARGFAFSP